MTSSLLPQDAAPYPAAPHELPSVPRPVGPTAKAQRVRFFLVVALFAAPVAVLYFGYCYGQNLRDLAADGRTISGQIEHKHVSHSRRSTAYHVSYAFNVQDRELHGDSTVSRAEYANFAPGSTCSVTYLPGRETVNCLGLPKPRLEAIDQSTLIFAGLAALVLTIVIGCKEFDIRRELYLLQFGEAVVGRVSERGQTKMRNGVRYWIRCHFETESGCSYEGRHDVIARIWNEVSAGTDITVLHDPVNPRIHKPLCAFAHVQFLLEEEECPIELSDQPDA